MDFDLARLRLRPATADDALCLGVLGTQVFLDTYATRGIRPTLAREVLAAFSPGSCAALLRGSGSRVCVAEFDGHLVGFSELRPGAAHERAPAGAQSELRRLYVQAPFSGRGVGLALLREAERAAAAGGTEALWLTSWAQNRRALRFYARCGYSDFGPTPYVFEDECHENRLLAKALRRDGAA
jgi:GNAT superfamily N-acetyltransferase